MRQMPQVGSFQVPYKQIILMFLENKFKTTDLFTYGMHQGQNILFNILQ